MIYKTFDLKKIPDNAIFYLLYGKNEGLKSDCINQILKRSDSKVFSYEEKQIRDENIKNFLKILKTHLVSNKEMSVFSGKISVLNKKTCIILN